MFVWLDVERVSHNPDEVASSSCFSGVHSIGCLQSCCGCTSCLADTAVAYMLLLHAQFEVTITSLISLLQ